MSQIISEAMIQHALILAKPSVQATLNSTFAIWGPKFVNGYIIIPGILPWIDFTFGEKGDYPDEFWEVARKKAEVSHREGISTREVVALKPWLLEKEEWMYPGAIHHDGITVSASGAKGAADEAISESIYIFIRMAAYLERDRRIEINQMQI